jgi:hypothetical protein
MTTALLMCMSSGKVTLNDPAGYVSLRENFGFSKRDLVRIQSELEANLATLLSGWESIHGTR